MWRPLARRALLNRSAAATKFGPPILHPQVSHHGTYATIEPSFSVSHFSTNFNFNQNPRFFSSNQSENYEDLPSESSISEASEIAGGSDFNATNLFGEAAEPEVEYDNSIFNDAIANLEGDKDFGANSDGSVGLGDQIFSSVGLGDQIFGAVTVGDESVEQVNENSPEKVESLLSLLQSSGTAEGSLESSLEGMGLVVDEEFVLKVLETPYVPGENLIGFFSWVLRKPEFTVTMQVLEVLVSMICQENRKRNVYALWDLVKEVHEKEKGVVSTKSLNELIAGFSRLGKGKAAFDAFNEFEEFGCLRNADTYFLTIEAVCKRSFYSWASSVCEKMLSADKLPDANGVGKIISYLCKGGMAKDAHMVYLFSKDKKLDPTRSSIDVLISSLSRIDRTNKGSDKEIDKEFDKETVSLALEMLNEYSEEDRKVATKSFLSVIKKLCWIEDVGRAKKLLLEMIDSDPPPGNDAFNCVINGLAKVGDMDEALKITKLMESRGLKPDVYTYSVIMSGYARGGAMEEAYKIYDEAKKRHSKLCPITYHTLIRGFCKLEQFDKAVNVLGEMRQHGVSPNHDEYNKLIKSLCFKALDWESAEKLQEEMKLNGLVLNGRTKALITAVKELKEEGINTRQPAQA